MKKKLLLVTTIVCLFACVFAFGACSEKKKPDEPPAHIHNYQWVDNGDGTHKRHCNIGGCDAPEIDRGVHNYVNGKCICGSVEEPGDITHTTHSFVNYVYNNDATCVTDGTETAKCEHCNETDSRISQDHLRTGVHTFITYAYNDDATCVTDGTETAKCEYCNERDTRVSKTHLHTGIHIFKTYAYNNDATCVTDGTETAKCEQCSVTDTRVSQDHLRTGVHTFVSYTYNNDATCIADGTETAKCEHCSETDSRISATHKKTGVHNYRDGACTVCGKIDDDAPITEGLAYAAVYDENDNSNIIGYSVSMGSATQKQYIKIPDTYNDKPVIAIGGGAFEQCWQLKNITIPDSVTSIGADAFDLCYNLTSITIPDSVKSIALHPFSDCASLTDITVQSGNTRYHSSGNCIIETESKTLIAGCKTSVIPNDGSVTSIGDCAFYCCRNITDVTIPNGVTSIGDSAFFLCNGLASVEIPSSVTSIGYRAFAHCSLTSVEIPSSVTSIGGSAFSGCSLTSISIPNSVTSIGAEAFSDCNKLTRITVQSGNKRYHGSGNCIIETASKTLIAGCKTSVIPNDGSVTSIGSYAFYGCSGLTSITIPNNVMSIGDNAFSHCFGLTSITIPNSVTSIGYGVFDNCSSLQFSLYDNGSYLGNGNNKYFIFVEARSKNITSCTIHDDTKIICGSAFYGCTFLMSVSMPNGVTSIGDNAFSGCRGLSSMTIGSSVTIVGERAFAYCDDLTNVIIPDSITSIGEGAFYGCDKLKYNEYENGLYLGNEDNMYVALIKTKNVYISSFTIHNNTKVIYESAFSGCKDLTSITIPGSVTCIGVKAFSDCANLAGITVQSGNTKYHGSGNCIIETASKTLIAGCKTSVIPNDGSVTSIKYGALSGCIGLTSVVIPNSVTSIGGSAFSGCDGLTSVVIPNSVTSIGGSAFSGCDGLTSVVIPNSVTSIEDNAFSGSSGLTIYCETESKPNGWSSYWKSSDCSVVWGYIPADAE